MTRLGLDFGSDQVRALIVRRSDGARYSSRAVDDPSREHDVPPNRNDRRLAPRIPRGNLCGLEDGLRAWRWETSCGANAPTLSAEAALAYGRPDSAAAEAATTSLGPFHSEPIEANRRVDHRFRALYR